MRKSAFAAVGALLVPAIAHANEPFTKKFDFSGPVDFFATGVPLGIDGPDADTTRVDILLNSSTVDITTVDIPSDATLKAAYVYWGGSITNNFCASLANMDDTVTFTPPGGSPTSVTADVCYCSDGGGVQTVSSYDLGACRAEVTTLLTGGMLGTFEVGDFAALINNGSTNTASWSIVIVYSQVGLPARRVGIYDGLITMGGTGDQGGAATQSVVLDQLEVDQAPAMGSLGDLTYYVMEGDAGAGGDRVDVYGTALGAPGIALSDASNPVDNTMNATITTTNPVQNGTIGVDIDRYDISSALTFNDTEVTVVLRAGIDKWWPIYNVVGVNVFEPVFEAASTKTWVLQDDADNNSVPSPGDTIRYTITMENTGSAAGTVSISDPIPAQAASWAVVDIANGVDASTANTLIINNISVAPMSTESVIFDLVIDDVPPFTFMVNTADWDASPEGGMGSVSAQGVIIQAAGDGDGDGDGTTGDGDGDGTTAGDGDGTTAGDGDGTTAGDGDGTTAGDGDGTTAGDGDGTTAGDGDGTSGDGDGTTTVGDGDGTSGDGDGTSGDGDGTSGDGDGTSGDGDGTSGDGDGTSGDGDGDGTSGDGDGTSGDGDGTSGDGDGTSGDGDGTSGDGDGTSGDGDGTSGDGDGTSGDGDGTSGDGDGTSGDGDGTSGDGDGTSGDGDGTSGDGDGTTSSGDGDGDGTTATSGDGDGTSSTSGDGDGDAGTTSSATGTDDGTDSDTGFSTTFDEGVIEGGDGDGCDCSTTGDNGGTGALFMGLAAIGLRRRRRG